MITLTAAEWALVCDLQAVAAASCKAMDRVAMGGTPDARETNRLMMAEVAVFQVMWRVREESVAPTTPEGTE